MFNWDDVAESKNINAAGEYILKVKEVLKDDNGNITQTTTGTGREFHKFLCTTQDGQTINVSFYLTDKAMWRYKKFITACGVDLKGKSCNGYDEIPGLVVGKKFIGVVDRQQPTVDVATGQPVESKYFEIKDFKRFEA